MRKIKAKTIWNISEKKFDKRLGEHLTEIGEENIVDIKVYSYASICFVATIIYRAIA